MSVQRILVAVALAGSFVATPAARAEDGRMVKGTAFGALKSASPDEARMQAQAWLRSVGKTDAASQKQFDQIWADQEAPVLDRVARTLALGDPEASRLLVDARDPAKAAPTDVPAVLKDTKKPAFYRSNLALAYAKALTERRVYEESLEALKSAKPEQVVDPAAYLFSRAVAEHALMQKAEATRSIGRLLDDAVDVPERYKTVSVLMSLDMQSWKDKDLAAIARKMDNIERRLELARGGPTTQKMQKEVVARLDELIKQIENQANQQSQANAGACPPGGQPMPQNLGGQPNQPMLDSMPGKNAGPGNVDPKKLNDIAKQWGKLPEKERAKAMQELTRDMPPKYREVIESYFRKLAASESGRP